MITRREFVKDSAALAVALISDVLFLPALMNVLGARWFDRPGTIPSSGNDGPKHDVQRDA